MFRLSKLFSFSALIILSTVWLVCLNSRNSAPSSQMSPIPKNSVMTSKQTRSNVRKDIWITDAFGQRLHHRIESDRSLITLHPKKSSINVLENLFGIRCWIQERTTNGKNTFQQVRFVLAEEGTYFYKDQSFRAYDVLLSIYKVPQSTLPVSLSSYTPYLRGNAESITFSMEKGTPRFVASRFKASLGEGGL